MPATIRHTGPTARCSDCHETVRFDPDSEVWVTVDDDDHRCDGDDRGHTVEPGEVDYDDGDDDREEDY